MSDWKPDICIYHSPCDDGFAAAWAVWQRWGDDVEFVPGVYGSPPPDVAGKRVLIVDFSFKKPVLDQMSAAARSIVILDHHKTAREDLAAIPPPYFGEDNLDDGLELGWPTWAIFDMNKSGARLAWEFCHPGTPVPRLIELVEDRDLWRFAFKETKAFSLYLRSHPYDFAGWRGIANELARDGGSNVINLEAAAIEVFYNQKVAELVREARTVSIGGNLVPVVNCSWAFASDVAHQLLEANPQAAFAACYYDRGDGRRSYSLRSEDDRVDVSEVAKANGGGGHRNAAGFETAIP